MLSVLFFFFKLNVKWLLCLERRKIERRIRRLEKLQRTSSGQAQDAEQLSKLKEDLEYVRVSSV